MKTLIYIIGSVLIIAITILQIPASLVAWASFNACKGIDRLMLWAGVK